MRSRRFESEAPRLFGSRNLLELLHTKNVIEQSVLRREGGARSAEEYELTRNASTRLKSETACSRSRFPYSGQRLIFHVAPARGESGSRRANSSNRNGPAL